MRARVRLKWTNEVNESWKRAKHQFFFLAFLQCIVCIVMAF